MKTIICKLQLIISSNTQTLDSNDFLDGHITKEIRMTYTTAIAYMYETEKYNS